MSTLCQNIPHEFEGLSVNGIGVMMNIEHSGQISDHGPYHRKVGVGLARRLSE